MNPDVLIVTALKMEYDALIEAAASMSSTPGKPLNLVQRDADGSPYAELDYTSRDGSSIKLALAYADRMSSIPVGHLSSTLIERLKPSCIAMCGVCAGNSNDVALGDVILAEMAYQFDEGKKGESDFQGDYRQTQLTDQRWFRLLGDLKPDDLPSYGTPTETDADLWFLECVNVRRDAKSHPARKRYMPDDVWVSRLQSLERKGFVRIERDGLTLTEKGRDVVNRSLVEGVPPKNLPFSIHVGPIASSNAVIKDGVTWDSLKARGVRTILGLEMEAATVAYVARNKGLNWVVAKGVMDYADARKDDRFKSFAARASAEVLLQFLVIQFGKPENYEDDPQKPEGDPHPGPPKPPTKSPIPLKTIGIVAIVLAVLAVGSWLFGDLKSASKFDAIYDQTFLNAPETANLWSAHNKLLNDLPNSINPQNELDQWNEISNVLSRDIPIIDGAYKDIAFCIASKDCTPGRRAESLCDRAKLERHSYNEVVARLLSMSGITVNRSISEPIMGGAFGPVVKLPDIPNLNRVLSTVCSIDKTMDDELRSMIGEAEEKQKKYEQEQESVWDGQMCEGFVSLLNTTITNGDIQKAIDKFPTKPICRRLEGETVACGWRDPVVTKGRFLGVRAGGGKVANLEVIERPLHECFGKAGKEDPAKSRVETDDRRLRDLDPFIWRNYEMELSGSSRLVRTEAETVDKTMFFMTQLAIILTKKQ